MPKKKKTTNARPVIDITSATSQDVLRLIRQTAGLRDIEYETGIDRGTLSRLHSGARDHTSEGNYRALIQCAIGHGIKISTKQAQGVAPEQPIV